MLALDGRLVAEGLATYRARLAAPPEGEGPVELDLSRVEDIDSAGVAMLVLVGRSWAAAGRPLKLVGASDKVQRTLDLFPGLGSEAPADTTARPGLVERVGTSGYAAWDVLLTYLVLCADTAWFTVGGLLKRKGIRWRAVAYEMSEMGAKALGVVGLIAFLVGGTMALQSAVQLRQFGANIFVVDLIGISMTRELGPLMAAIVVAGRSGSSVAAEVGTMVITEEIDALKTMGLHPTRFLIVPKFLAISVTQPLLTALADLAGIVGGFLVAVLYLEVGPVTFMDRLQETLYVKDLLTGLVKSVIFAQLIVTVGALCGLRTKGGADAVGRSTTLAVVAGIFSVIVADAVASMVFYFGE
jgi:phospholipid/cholesterol/gamma-HCH transport system permease protein